MREPYDEEKVKEAVRWVPHNMPWWKSSWDTPPPLLQLPEDCLLDDDLYERQQKKKGRSKP